MPSSDNDPPKKHRVEIGRDFEKQAALFFEQNGFEVLHRNWQFGHKEIDIIVRKDQLIVFVEVKSSATGQFGHPAERVDNRKVENLTQAARAYLIEHEISGCDLRFDLVTFVDGSLEHYPDAFEASS
ncbi:MAG: YraN family protein [bacterium]|nr:YraN family protein [bacterium]